MRLNSRIMMTVGGLLLVAGLLAIPTSAQEPRTRTKGTTAPRATEKAPMVHPMGVHVPDHFNQIEPPITESQRERIYEIQTRALHESEALLSAAQKSSLQSHRAKAANPARDSGLPGSEPRNTRTPKKAG